MSLPWAVLLKRLSIRLQPHGPSHLIRSQWKPVGPCHHSYCMGPGCNRRHPLEHGAWHAEEAISLQREDIMWLMYNSVSHVGRRTWQERGDNVRQGDTRKGIIYGVFIKNWKPHPRFYQSNCPPFHSNNTWMWMRTIIALQNSKAFCHFVSLSLSPPVFPSLRIFPPLSLISIH